MLIKIGQFDVTECWDGVFYKKLSHYPNITTWEMQTVLDFIKYEESYGRVCKIEAERQIIEKIENYRDTYEKGVRISPPAKIEECTACPKYQGCMTDYVCHTTSVDNAIKILKTGKLLSPVLARNMSAAGISQRIKKCRKRSRGLFPIHYVCMGKLSSGRSPCYGKKAWTFSE